MKKVIVRRGIAGADLTRGLGLQAQRVRDRITDAFLDIENGGKVGIETLGPQMMVGGRFYQL